VHLSDAPVCVSMIILVLLVLQDFRKVSAPGSKNTQVQQL
jgi:hypothetical protein